MDLLSKNTVSVMFEGGGGRGIEPYSHMSIQLSATFSSSAIFQPSFRDST